MKNRILLCLICCTVMQTHTFAAPDIVPYIIPQAGTINTHDPKKTANGETNSGRFSK